MSTRHDFTRRSAGGANWYLLGFLAIAGYFLLSEHRAHAINYLPFLLLLACPLMHLFMHGGHGQHGGHEHGDGRDSGHSGHGGGGCCGGGDERDEKDTATDEHAHCREDEAGKREPGRPA